MSVTLLGENSTLSAVTSIGVSITVPAGGAFLEVYVTTGTTITGVSDSSGNGNIYTLAGSATDTVDVQTLSRYVSSALVSAGTFTVTAAFGTSAAADGIAVLAIVGTAGPLATLGGAYQASPGTGTAGVTTGLSGTLASEPALLTGLTITTHLAASITAAGGATQLGSTIWNTIKANFGFIETKALFATTSVAATFTSANGNPQVSVGGVWSVTTTNDLVASGASYAYTGGTATLSASTAVADLLAFPGTYNYTLALSSSAFQLLANVGSYSYVGFSAALVPVFPSQGFTAGFGSYSIAAQDAALTLFVIPPNGFPSLINQYYWVATLILQQVGALVPEKIGYFGTWPITIEWEPSSAPPGTVLAQSVAPGTLGFVPNSPIILTVSEFPIAVEYP